MSIFPQMEVTVSWTDLPGSISSGAYKLQNLKTTPLTLMPSFHGYTPAVPSSGPGLPCQHYSLQKPFSSRTHTKELEEYKG